MFLSQTESGATIHYTLDGSEPDESSPAYSAPLLITNTTLVRAKAFAKGEPGLSSAAVSVTCDSKRLSEVRVCLSKDLQFRSCEEIDRRACRRDEVLMPPIRGG